MKRNWRGMLYAVVGSLFCGLTMECATANLKVTVLYQPVVHDGTGAGELYLAGAGGSASPAGVQWILGTVKDSDGEPRGDIVSPIDPADLVMDAFRQELAAAGYAVSTVSSLPSGGAKGLVITGTDIRLDEVSSLVKAEGTSRVKVSLEVWNQGQVVKRLSYEERLSDFAVKDRDQLLPTILQKALQEIMKQAVPEVVRALGN
jgi:hypothetical protein